MMRRSALVMVAVPFVLSGCIDSPSTGWQGDEYSGSYNSLRPIGSRQREVRSGYGFRPRIDVGSISIDGVKLRGPR